MENAKKNEINENRVNLFKKYMVLHNKNYLVIRVYILNSCF